MTTGYSADNPPGGSRWFAVGPERPTHLITLADEDRLEEDLYGAERLLYDLTAKIARFRALCHKYEKWAGTARGEGYLQLMVPLKREIHTLCEALHHRVDETLAHAQT